MKRLFLWALSSALCLQSFAQNPTAQKYASVISLEDARKHLTILASDEFEGRETGKPGATKAAEYIAAEFKRLGLTAPVNGSYFQNVPLIETSFVVNSFIANQTPLTNWKDFYITAGPETAKTVTVKEIVFVGYGISSPSYDDLKNTDIAGKVVLVINEGEPVKGGISAITKTAEQSDWSRSRTMRIQSLRSKNPAAILAVSSTVAAMLQRFAGNGPAPRLTIKGNAASPASPQAPVFNITPELANILLKNSGKTYESLRASINEASVPQTQAVKADFSTSFSPKVTDVKAVNVLGFMQGTDLKDEILVFSAHYDHIGLNPGGPDFVNNGADDDGSGTTGILEIARAFSTAKKEGKGPRRSILFLTVVGEEKGLLGSEWYTDNPIFPLSKTITDLNIDMIGRIDPAHAANPDYCYLVGSDKLSTELHKISEETNALYTKLTIDYKYNDPNDPEQIYFRSDHYNFAKHNVPIIFYFNGVHEDYHKPGDEVSKINFDMLVKRAQLVFYTGWELANRDKRPIVDVLTPTPRRR